MLAAAACAASATAYPGSPLAVKLAARQAHGSAVTHRWEQWVSRAARASTRRLAGVAAPDRAARVTASAVDRAVLARINAVRTGHGVRPLVLSPGLMSAARRHSLEMVRRGYFSHQSADGSSFDSRIRRYYRGLRSAGENIAFGCPDLGPGEAMSLWLNSPGHRRNILDPRWREIGISVVHVESAPGPDYRGDPTTVATTDFGLR